MVRTSADGKVHRSAKEDVHETIAWIRRHAPLTELCRFGGWPDDARLKVEVCSRAAQEWIVNITFVEAIMEISECDVTERERCGQYSVSFDEAGYPTGIRLIQPL